MVQYINIIMHELRCVCYATMNRRLSCISEAQHRSTEYSAAMLHLRAESKLVVLVLVDTVFFHSLQGFACSVLQNKSIVMLCVIVQLQANLLTTSFPEILE